MSNYSDASIVMYPSSRKTSEIYSQKPVDDSGNLVFSCNTARDEINSLGVSTEVAVNIPRYDYKEDYVAPIDNSYYALDGINDYIGLPNPTVSVVTDPFSSIVKFKSGIDVTTLQILYSNSLDSNNALVFGISNGSFSLMTVDGATSDIASIPILPNTEYLIGVSKPNTHTGLKKIYISGVLQVLGTPIALNYTTNVGQYLGIRTNISLYYMGDIYTSKTFNIELTAQEFLDDANGLPIPDKYKGANNSTILSGAFVIGKQYRILVPGTTDFTLIGASDSNIGTEFTATGIGVGTGTATSIGNTLNLSTGKTTSTWYDLDHDITGVVTGAVLNNSTDFGNNFNGVSTCPNLLLEPSFTNYFLNSRTPVTQTVSGLSIGTEYTINCKNAGIITAVEPGGAGQGGTITEVYPFTYIATQTSILLTLSAVNSFEFVQLSNTSSEMNHVETLGVSVTKALDTASKSGLSSYIDSESGVLFTELKALSDDGTNRNISLSDGTTSNRIHIYLSSVANTITARCVKGGVAQASLDGTVVQTNLNKVAFSWKQDEFRLYINGVKVSEDLSGDVLSASTLNRLGFDAGSGSDNLLGKNKQITVMPYLTDAELITLTTL